MTESATADYEVWTAMMEDAVDCGDVLWLPPVTIAGRSIPGMYWNPAWERNPRVPLWNASAVLASACACRGAMHPECVWPTIKRGEQVADAV